MKTLSTKAKISGLTLIELVVVILMLAVIAAMLLPAFSGRGSTTNVRCMSNQKQIALGHIIWASDYEGNFPAQVSIINDGAMELVSSGYACLQFRPLSDDIPNSKVFICPADKVKQSALSCKDLRDENVSYFINVEANTNNPSRNILTGDRNLQANGQPVKPGLFDLNSNLDMSWTRDLHSRGGVLAFADGHVQFVKTNDLNSIIRSQPLPTNRLCVP